MSKAAIDGLVGKHTHGAAIPVLGSSSSPTAQILGTVHDRRGRWNPFLPDNDMSRIGDVFVKELHLRPTGGRHGDGVYAFRFVIDHNLRKVLKADHEDVQTNGKPRLVMGSAATRAHNIMIRIRAEAIYRVTLDLNRNTFDLTPTPEYLTQIESVQLNGFVWDDEDMFQKFDEQRPNHEMRRNGHAWELAVTLRSDGGLPSRRDGVYQFLFSANHNEDWGFGGDNDTPLHLSGGTGFGSSGGRSVHSALTVKVFESGVYTVRMDPRAFRMEIVPANALRPPRILNRIESVQLLGTMYEDKAFDPTAEGRTMDEIGPGIWRKSVNLSPGVYGVNFALSRELFLDTMALGAWLATSDSTRLAGRAWHGKPNEPNVLFEVLAATRCVFTYDRIRDEFAIDAEKAGALRPVATVDSMQLVGDFDPPLAPWAPSSAQNDMIREGPSVFYKDVLLEAGRTYRYKYTSNRLGWLWVFADYELDGYGGDLRGDNPDVVGSTLEHLKRYGHLTTHGDPSAMSVTPQHTGLHRFALNLETGAYSVLPRPNGTE